MSVAKLSDNGSQESAYVFHQVGAYRTITLNAHEHNNAACLTHRVTVYLLATVVKQN